MHRRHKYRIGNLGPAKSSIETVCYEYISTILHVSIYIVKELSFLKSTVRSYYFNYLYGIITTAMNWYFIMYIPEKIYCMKANYYITLTEDVLDNNDDRELRQGMKKVMKVIVDLLKDRVEVDDFPDLKRARMENFIKE
ncbi:4006_t:CDS:2 [Funneliformis geosporum]|nr:4006_t:CDS:2 [Funneliformis geosporum]